MADDVTGTLARRFVQMQNIDQSAALEVAEKILGADEDIAEAARSWLGDDRMPDTPTVKGHSPASLASRYSPSQVFTILIALRRDPVRAQQMLKRFHG